MSAPRLNTEMVAAFSAICLTASSELVLDGWTEWRAIVVCGSALVLCVYGGWAILLARRQRTQALLNALAGKENHDPPA